jgi:hypothetical protein
LPSLSMSREKPVSNEDPAEAIKILIKIKRNL